MRRLVAWTSSAILLIITLIASATISRAQSASPSDASTLYQQLTPSLALVAAKEGKDVGFGTAFCISSHDNIAYFLTNKHVVATDSSPRIVLLSDQTTVLYATVERVSTLDAAILSVKNEVCKPLTLSKAVPPIGTAVGIVGFPAFQLTLFGNGDRLSASFHAGSVSATASGGDLIEYDAQTDHGNSGSPLFDMRSGVVYGLVRAVNTGTTGALQNNIAISVNALSSFLDNSRATVAYTDQIAQPTRVGTAPPAGSNFAAVDAKCGSGVTQTITQNLSKSYAELNANDYATSISDSRSLVELANTCLNQFGACPQGSNCDDSQRVIVASLQLSGQQILRMSTARSGGTEINSAGINALRNETDTVLLLCDSPNILSEGAPYPTSRGLMVASLNIVKKVYRAPAFRNVFNEDALKVCGSKLGISF